MERLKVNLLPLTIFSLLGICVLLVIIFGIQNRGAATTVTASGTLVAAIAFYFVNLFTSLSAVKQTTFFPVEIAIDRSTNFVGGSVYTLNQSFRAMLEREIVKWMMTNQPNLLIDQENKVVRDFMIVSILNWFSSQEFDWQAEAKILKTSEGTISTKGITSDKRKSVVITEKELQNGLAAAGNIFSDGFQMRPYKELILPRGSKLMVSSNSISIFHPVFELKIEVGNEARLLSNANPRNGKMDLLGPNRPRYTIYIFEGAVTSEISKWRSGDINKARYEAWFVRLKTGIQDWFATVPVQNEAIPIGATITRDEEKGASKP